MVYRWDFVADKCGVMGPNAVTTQNGIAYWMTPEGQFKAYSGGLVVDLDSTCGRDMRDHLAPVQGEKVFAFSTSAESEVGWLYPDTRDDPFIECSRFLDYKTNAPDANIWTPNEIERTAWLDAGVFPFPLATGRDGRLYFHEKGFAANGLALPWELRRGIFDIGSGETLFQIDELIPGF